MYDWRIIENDAVKSLLIKKGIITEKELIDEYNKIRNERRDLLGGKNERNYT